MCVIIASPDQKHRPSLETLRECEAQNPHGSGAAWRQHNKIQWIKGLSAEALEELGGIVQGPLLIHFRIATVGGKSLELCHPFPISPLAPLKPCGQAGSVLFHNGHWAEWEEFANEEEIQLKGAVSDSRVLAVGIHLKGRKLLRGITGSRFAILGKKGYALFGQWHRLEGCDFSNLCWRRPAPPLELNFSAPKPRRIDPGEAMACFAD